MTHFLLIPASDISAAWDQGGQGGEVAGDQEDPSRFPRRLYPCVEARV